METVLTLSRPLSVQDMVLRYQRVRKTTLWICEPLTIEDQVIQTSTECSPTKWQLGHTTWFFETFVLKAFAEHYQEYHPRYNFLFNSYYNTVGERVARSIRGLMSRPTVGEILEYREHVDRAMLRLFEIAPERVLEQALEVIMLGLHHEQQHQELIVTDVKTVLALNPLHPVYREREVCTAPVPELTWTMFEAGLHKFGHTGDSFAFDNEGPRHQQYIEPYAIANRLITNSEYLAFMADGGYTNPLLWLSDGWALCQSEQWRSPLYWQSSEDGEWRMMTLQGLRAVEGSEPVTHISHYEADAFATWSGARLATEFEWERAAASLTALPQSANFLERSNFHPVPLTESSTGLAQFFGDVWEWTRSAYLPYPGYRTAEGALGEYNGKFMSNQMVLRGGSCITSEDHIRSSYRNFFPPASRWQFSGIRLAKDAR